VTTKHNSDSPILSACYKTRRQLFYKMLLLDQN